jgi:hypothetical protein
VCLTFDGIQLIPHHLLRHKSGHIDFLNASQTISGEDLKEIKIIIVTHICFASVNTEGSFIDVELGLTRVLSKELRCTEVSYVIPLFRKR